VRTVRKNLECSICFKDKIPTLSLLLPCCHTLCGTCATGRQNTKCPQCHVMTCDVTRVFL